MDLKTYEKTRYQNIYRHKKNKNYLIMISNPVKTSIASINGEKILKLEEALKIRDNPIIKVQKQTETGNRETFDSLWYKYIAWCKTTEKQANNTILRKNKVYNKYLKGTFNKTISKIKEENFLYFLEKLDTTNKNKNNILKTSKAFFNWCVSKKILLFNPISNIKKYKEDKPEMKYWTPEEIKKFFDTINKEIEYGNNKEIAYRTKIFALIGFSLGDRTGETLNLKFNDFDYKNNIVSIKGKKTKSSERVIDVSPKLIEEIKTYKWHLINEFDYDIIEDELIFCNHNTKKPLSDTAMRKHFYYYVDLAGVTKIRMYDLRHTYVATMMMEGKELYHISQRLGHTNYNTTVDKYGHLSNKIRKEIAESTDKYI